MKSTQSQNRPLIFLLLVFAGIGANMGISICVSVFLVFADSLVDENSYLGYFATKQFYVGLGFVSVATDGISNIKTIGYGSYLGLSASAPSTGFGYAGFYVGWAYYNAII